MSSGAVTILGSSVLALLLAGYLAQHYLPPPKPKIVGIDLGTTYSCVGVYHAVTGNVDVLKNKHGRKCIPSVVAFSDDAVVVGYEAEAQAEKNPENTIYDAKRFIGKTFNKEELAIEASRYAFQLKADEYGMVRYVIGSAKNTTTVTPQDIGARIISTLKQTAEANLTTTVKMAVMSVPAEFNEMQRNYTKMAAKLAGIEILRIINEPTAAALAYGLHKKEGLHNVLVVDLGGGTLDVSLLNIQGGMFLTQGMAGNNHLGGQDFNMRLFRHLVKLIESHYNFQLSNPEDLQNLRQSVENAKLNLTYHSETELNLYLRINDDRKRFKHVISRQTFEDINIDLFKKVLEPIQTVLKATELVPDEVDEIVLVGGSTRIPKVRELIRDFFGKELNTAVDPELAVASGVSIQAGILGGMWPLTVSALELPTKAKKIQVL